jgi:hypothetical protein
MGIPAKDFHAKAALTPTYWCQRLFTPPPLFPDGIHFCLNLVLSQRLAGLAAHVFEHLTQLLSGAGAAKFIGKHSPSRFESRRPLARASLTSASGKSTSIVTLISQDNSFGSPDQDGRMLGLKQFRASQETAR